jgi:hypothetical protein
LRITAILLLIMALPWAATAKRRKAADAEVEINAILSGASAVSFALFASDSPCEPSSRGAPYGSTRTKTLGPAFLEIFVPQGARVHICAAGFDEKGRVVAWGRYAKNPVKCSGEGEVEFSDVRIELSPLDKPVAAPPGI